MASFYESFIKEKKSILIPVLQRDYVQGGRKDIIVPFINQLFDVVKSDGKSSIELNYIYGYSDEENGFIPIDGQQRLITLWLFHLYLYKKGFIQVDGQFPELNFQCREYTQDFVAALLNESFVEDISNSCWFITSWLKDFTVYNMVNTWSVICNTCKKLNLENSKNIENNLQNISFKFADLKKYKLGDDIYLKMNGRGRPLSYFDNLKSYMDEKVSYYEALDSKWKESIDNKWTDFFWRNRNKSQKNQEEIDDEQIRFFYSALLLYWLGVSKNTIEDNITTMDPGDRNLLFDELGVTNKDNKAAEDKIIEILRAGNKAIPLYWIDKLKLFNNYVFDFIYESLNKLCDMQDFVNELRVNLFLIDNKNENTKLIYKIALKDATYKDSLLYLYSILKTPKIYIYDKNNFTRWMRLIRNLIVNKNNIDLNVFKHIMRGIDELSNKCQSCNIYKDLFDLNKTLCIADNKVFQFDKIQLDEETFKINHLFDTYTLNINQGKELEKRIFEAEESLFLTGKINFLFMETKDKINWENFELKYNSFMSYFDNNGLKEEAKHILVYFLIHWPFKWNEFVFNVDDATWGYILTNLYYTEIINSILTQKFDLPIKEIKDNDYITKNKVHFRKLLQDKDNHFINFLLKNDKLRGGRVRENWGTAIYQYNSKNGGVYLNKINRDDFLWEGFINKKITFVDKCNKNLWKAYESLDKEKLNNITPFFYGRDIEFKMDTKYFKWMHTGHIELMVSSDCWKNLDADYDFREDKLDKSGLNYNGIYNKIIKLSKNLER